MKTMKTLFASAALLLAAQGVSAADVISVGYTQLSETVSYADLDVNKPEGAQALYKRLNRAAKTVCAPLRGRDLQRASEHRACLGEALANAVGEVNQPLLTQHHNSRGADASAAIVAKR
jgi:UrcA family protein